MAESIEFRLKVIEDKLGIALEQNEKKAKSLGSAINVALGSFASTVAVKGISLLSDGFKNLAGFVSDSVKAASESQDALNSLNLALSQTGILTEGNVKAFQDLATQIQATTAYEDDAVISTAAYIQALGRLDSEGLQRATRAALDLSAALSIDLESASTIVGKASEGNTVALQKLGIQFQKGKSDAETFANILTTLETRFGGAAEAQVKTFSGAIAQLSNVFNSLQENIGNAIIKNPAVIAGFKTINTAVVSLGNAIATAFGGTSGDLIARFINELLTISQVVLLIADPFVRAFDIVADVISASFKTINAGFLLVTKTILEVLSLIPFVGDKFSEMSSRVSTSLNDLAKSVGGNVESIREALSGDSILNSLRNEILLTKKNFNDFYFDLKLKQEDLKNNPIEIFKTDGEAEKRAQALNDALLSTQKSYEIAKNEAALQSQIAEDEIFATRTAKQIQQIGDFELQKSQVQYDAEVAAANRLATLKETNIAKDKALIDRKIRDVQIGAKTEADIKKQQLSDQQAFFSAASSLASSSNKELAMLGKASAITEIAIRTPRAVAQSFEFGTRIGGPALGFSLGAIAGVAMAAQAAKVAGVQGFANGGIVGATSGPDNTMATVRNGEMILNAEQQKSLFDMINSGGSGGGDIIIQVDGREIAKAVRSQLQQGFRLA